jgi:hypothetical protein
MATASIGGSAGSPGHCSGVARGNPVAVWRRATAAVARHTAVVRINWNAALTALLVTLTVELLLRPYLERRKERFMDTFRTQRELRAEIVSLAQSARFVGGELPKDAGREVRENFRVEQRRQDEQMAARVQRMFDQSGRYAAAYGLLMDDVIDYIACLQGLMLSGRPRDRKAEIIVELAEPAARVFDASIWRPILFMNARAELQRRIKATWPDEPDQAEEDS